MTSDPAAQAPNTAPRTAFVWTWLPGSSEPVVAGRLDRVGEEIRFQYGRTYRARADAIALYLPELPLGAAPIAPPPGLAMAGAIRDGSPDAWGRRVILNRTFGGRGQDLDEARLDELTFLLESGSDRIGALDFQQAADRYEPRGGGLASLEELIESAERVERNIPLSPELDQALQHGTAIGGARPKALIVDGETKHIAKFSSSTDIYSVVKGEFLAMRLAALAGLAVAPVRLVEAAGKDVLLVERFDRTHTAGRWHRKALVSALTVLELDEMQARYASYEDLAEKIRLRFEEVPATLRELFGRMTYNVLVGNLDDHARNHAAFWDGNRLALTPAYDICPQPRTGEEASQAMLIRGQDRMSQIRTCLAAAAQFHLDEATAIATVAKQVEIIGENWRELCTQARLGEVDRKLFWGRQFLNRFAFYGLEGAAAPLAARAAYWREHNA
ncbi:type II toxin-antitoxin system HipA family toxin [Novosphingobium sp. JCM 18896]|uniref:type II toxin-antitoxin system HipA family toxin n=1 Tax=Novosphingobium sp. JCM 18896 TaxID=2989731 RepID=UPI0022234021|nr:HipA domain-containing protein [Novosphingobium sp. JCM 18896]MCW1430895.1 HipA domain-containing protein [Novosphingobium sp. JCM 18896]